MLRTKIRPQPMIQRSRLFSPGLHSVLFYFSLYLILFIECCISMCSCNCRHTAPDYPHSQRERHKRPTLPPKVSRPGAHPVSRRRSPHSLTRLCGGSLRPPQAAAVRSPSWFHSQGPKYPVSNNKENTAIARTVRIFFGEVFF